MIIQHMFQKRSLPRRFLGLMAIGLFMVSISACGGGTPAAPDSRLKVLATTSIVGDVVNQVGAGYINLTVLMPVGTDPHDYQPRPQDAAAVANARLIISNGAGLETFLQPLLDSTASTATHLEVSQGITLLPLPGSTLASAGDPHTWMDPNNVVIWTQNIATALSSTDPAHAADYQANAKTYTAALQDLDAWIRTQVAQIPPQNRLLLSDHAVLGYFAQQYGFTLEGTLTGSFSSDAAPSAQELAALENTIRQTGVKAIFVSEAVNQSLADQVAADTGIKAVWIYHATLTAPGGPAPSYLDFMRYNVNAIVNALK